MALKILSHNVYWFQGHPFSKSGPEAPHQEILRRLCTLYREVDASVLCLQEIQNADAAAAVATEMRMNSLHARGMVYPQYGSMIATKFDASVRPSNQAPFVLERSLVVAEIAPSSGPLKVACIHLTSGRQTSALEAKAARVEEISKFLTAYGAETDVLMGDFNEDPDGETANLLRANGFLDTASLCGMASVPTLVSSTHRRDLIWIKDRWQNRLVDYGVIQEDIAVKDIQGIKFLSDHRPIWITLDA